jgi:hypothetical protein
MGQGHAEKHQQQARTCLLFPPFDNCEGGASNACSGSNPSMKISAPAPPVTMAPKTAGLPAREVIAQTG